MKNSVGKLEKNKNEVFEVSVTSKVTHIENSFQLQNRVKKQ